MQKIKAFCENYITDEFNCNVAKYDYNVTNREYEILEEKVYSYFDDSMSKGYGRAGAIDKKDDIYLKLSNKKIKNTRKRILFQIKEFEDPILGDGLKRIVRGNRIYRADMSYELKTPSEFSKFSRSYYIADTDSGLKIIYFKRFDIKNGVWEHQHDWKPSQVLEDGNLIGVEKLETPIEPNSLKEYNKD